MIDYAESAFSKKHATSNLCSTISSQPFYYSGNFDSSLALYNISTYDPLLQALPKKNKKDKQPNIQGPTGTSTYFYSFSQELWEGATTNIDFLSNDVKFIEKIGEGQFGEAGFNAWFVRICEDLQFSFYFKVYLCEALGFDSNANSKATVMMKFLKPYTSEKIRCDDFHSEFRITFLMQIDLLLY